MKYPFLKYIIFVANFYHLAHPVAKPKPANLTFVKQCIADYYTDGRYDKEMQRATNKAWTYLKKRKPKEKDAIIFDVDDTALSTFKDALAEDFAFIPKLKGEWIEQADAPAIKPVKELYTKLKDKGFKIIFLTGRHDTHRDATIKNLKSAGFGTYEKLILRSPAEKDMKATDYKVEEHKKLARDNYHIIACIGDQWSDLNGKTCGYTVKVPNYMYIIE